MAAKDDRPGVPDDVEAAAIRLFEAGTQAVTGNVWKWEESDQDIRNRWRIKALLAERK